MKPGTFQYYRPSSLSEALELKASFGSEAVILAGGQSLIPMLNMRLARPQAVIDLGGLRELEFIEGKDGGVAVGAMTRQRAVERSEVVRERCPIVTSGLTHVAHPIIRNRGTVGGSIAHADPAAELPAVLVALDGSVTVTSVRGSRVIAATDFFQFHMTTAAEPDEIVTEVRFPPVWEGGGWYFDEIARRHGDFALAGVAAQGRDARLRMVFFGVGPRPMLVTDPEGAAEAVEPADDLHGSAAYRRQLVSVLARRAREAIGL